MEQSSLLISGELLKMRKLVGHPEPLQARPLRSCAHSIGKVQVHIYVICSITSKNWSVDSVSGGK